MHFYIDRACEYIASWVTLSMHEVAVVAATTQLVVDTTAASPKRCADSDDAAQPTMDKREAGSPVSIETEFGIVSKGNQELLRPLTTLTTLIVYSSLVQKKMWDARFLRGQRAEKPADWLKVSDRDFVRRLATRHIGEAAADGWNCVAGAMQLVNAWALQSEEIPRVLPPNFELPFNTRLRMAVCLNVSWKFQRAQYSRFPRKFYNYEEVQPTLLAPHTHELAFIGYCFMTAEEQELFGGWTTDNTRAIRAMYSEMLAQEVDLISHIDVFTLLTGNVQVQTETRVHDIFERYPTVSADCALAARSLVPFFLYCAARGTDPTAGALLCAAFLALSTATNPRAKFMYAPEFFRAEFCAADRGAAWGLINSALHPSNLAAHMIVLGCYNDPAWENYDFVEPQNLRVAQVMAAAVA